MLLWRWGINKAWVFPRIPSKRGNSRPALRVAPTLVLSWLGSPGRSLDNGKSGQMGRPSLPPSLPPPVLHPSNARLPEPGLRPSSPVLSCSAGGWWCGGGPRAKDFHGSNYGVTWVFARNASLGSPRRRGGGCSKHEVSFCGRSRSSDYNNYRFNWL
jgi:hypothetical protein